MLYPTELRAVRFVRGAWPDEVIGHPKCSAQGALSENHTVIRCGGSSAARFIDSGNSEKIISHSSINSSFPGDSGLDARELHVK